MSSTKSEQNSTSQNEQSESSKLGPIWESKNLKEDIKYFEAHNESKEIFTSKCPHKKLSIANGELRCACGASWGGPNLIELEKILLSR